LLIAAAVLLIGVPVFAVLHNVFYALAAMSVSGILSDGFVFLSTASFLLAVVICPAGFVFCLLAALLRPLTAGWSSVSRWGFLVAVPVIVAVVASLVLQQWLAMSTVARDEAAGFNGSFEVVADGLPANWHVYDKALERGDARLVYDPDDPVDGAQSLEMVVQHADGSGGWRSAGLFQDVDAEAGQTYRVSFSLKSRGARVRLRIDSEKGDFRRPHEPTVETLEAQDTGGNVWRRVERDYTVPDGYRDIRFEINVLSPGTVWIDDVRIEPVR
jgi:hypothetical protein